MKVKVSYNLIAIGAVGVGVPLYRAPDKREL